MNKIALLLSTVIFIGYFPLASGTFSSFIAILIWWFFVPNNFEIQLLIIFLIIIIGIITSYLTEKQYNMKDPSFIVIDEFAGMFISLILIPKNIFFYFIGFVLFRVLHSLARIPNRDVNLHFGLFAGSFIMLVIGWINCA